jgi:competence protein ComEC
MKLTFFNVGQGDSIVAEWKFEGENKIAVIDCKSNLGKNPVLEYILSNNYSKIEFLILSHPHSDHFSGIKELIEGCINRGIKLKYFYHTATLSPNRIKTAVTSPIALNEITNLYLLLVKLKDNDEIKVCAINETGFDVHLNSEWSFKVLSPSFNEFDSYSKNSNYNTIHQDEEPGNEPFANLLSTILVFFNDSGYFILTSDAVIDTFYRLDKSYKTFFNSKKLLLGQIPHHGSSRNFKPIFWKNKNPLRESVPVVISVGKNGYKHPNMSVIENLTKQGFNIFLTEDINIFSQVNRDNLFFADLYSSPVPLNKALSFTIIGDKAVKN